MNEELLRNSRPLLECLDARSINQPRRKRQNIQRIDSSRSHDEHIDGSPNDIGRSTIDICEPTSEHLNALQIAFNKILHERILSENSYKVRQVVFNKLHQLILSTRPDCQITLYGSLLFECCLEKPGIMDIDVQFKQILQYDTLKELLDIITKSDLCKEARIDTEHKPSCLDLIINEPNMRVRITSGYIRGIHLSKLIRLYTKFDSRLIKLLRLFRILAKICNIDKPDFGTLHPIVFHLMVIHFLQQVEPPVLPCLHEYIYGIDHVPITLNENQYSEFFRFGNEYSREWKSANTTNVEMLFLQLLSYYMKTFNSKQFVVSIQTRMPVVKIDKNWHSRKLLVEDPTDIKRSLCQTMQAARSLNYFRDTLNTALNYFGRKQKKIRKPQVNSSTTDDDWIEVIAEDENEIPSIAPSNGLHNSYQLFYKRLPTTIVRDVNIRQNRVRDCYKKAFDQKLSEPLIKLNAMVNQQIESSQENEVEEAFQHDLEQNFETMDANDDEQNVLLNKIISVNEEDENFNTDFRELQIDNEKSSTIEQSFSSTCEDEKVNDTSMATSGREPENVVNESVDSSSQEPSPSELFYDFQADNFHAEQGAPFVCTTCNGVGHLKSECPDLIVPNLIDLPELTQEWLAILSRVCHQVTERCQPTATDIENRERILKQLQKQFEKDYPDCNLHAFGSFYNGFGFRQSDLDVCIVFKDQHEENTDEVIQVMRKLLRSMRLNADTFENVQPVLHAKVPIIRSKHRRLQIEIDISFHNMLAIENTRLLKTYTKIDPRVSQLGYMIKHLTKSCDIADASRGTLSSYAYILMVIHFLQQTQPPVLPVLQQLSDDPTKKDLMLKKCSVWNVYFYEDLSKLNTLWKSENDLSVGALWVEFLRFYTEQFNYDEHIVTIRQKEPLSKHEKGWFRQTIAIEDPFELSHNLAGGLSVRNWTMIRRVLIRARQQFGVQSKDIDSSTSDVDLIESTLFNVADLCPSNAPKRCPECKGPYHIRKRCPKLITLANEKERLKRVNLPQQQHQMLINNSYPLYSNIPPNANYSQYSFNPQHYYPTNGYAYPYPTLPPQRIWTQPYSNDQPMIYPAFAYHTNTYQQSTNFNRSYHPNNSRRFCFICGDPSHIRAQCPRI
ncbi:unnamed protein product [Adineta ricciae]|uniref:CCHC-type domain-containing protein n=1 Tax=Adineta ricciae TaxID=249248 RepID=A0A814PWG4_ADIRI|nr:unnamed protein product [Adineta ricciae]